MHDFFNLIFHVGIVINLKLEELWTWEFENFLIFLKKLCHIHENLPMVY